MRQGSRKATLRDAISYRNPLRQSHSKSKHRYNGRARLLPSVRAVQLGRSFALPYIRLTVILSMRPPQRVPVSGEPID